MFYPIMYQDMMGLAGRYTAQPSPLDEEKLQIELSQKNYAPRDYARELAERKAHAMGVTMQHDGEVTLIIGSDTIVNLNGSICEFTKHVYTTSFLLLCLTVADCPQIHPSVEKPKDEADAFNMIQSLSGNWHQVHTGVAV